VYYLAKKIYEDMEKVGVDIFEKSVVA